MRSERKHNKMDVSDQCFHCFINGLPLELGIWKEDRLNYLYKVDNYKVKYLKWIQNNMYL